MYKMIHSQLEAALLGHVLPSRSSTADEDDQETHEDELDYTDVDEEYELETTTRVGKLVPCGKSVTLQNLLAANVLQPGIGVMSIEYLGQRFIADLLPDGKIRSQETGITYASPSAWAVACKRFINPDKKSGCGWASIKYRGRKLDIYKSMWFKNRKDDLVRAQREDRMEEIAKVEEKFNLMAAPQYLQRIVVKHNTIANRTFTHDANTLIECVPFSNLGKIQPFLISLTTNAALLMDFHCHLTRSEVSGYLAGQWDVNSHSLQVTHAFPCKNTKADRENGPQVEAEIQKSIEKQKLLLVGWYHSHPHSAAAPTLRDIDAQLDYQIRMKGMNDSSYTPCIGIIISPYSYENPSLESSIISYWVIPPPENKPNEYGRPMLMSYSVIQDNVLAPSIKEEMQKCVDYYKTQNELITFTDKYMNNTSYIEKLKTTLLSKFPQDQSDMTLWSFVRDLVGCSVDEDSLLTIPTVTKSSQILPPCHLNTPTLNSNLMLTSDIASMLFNSGKFPSASSLLGLPDPMAHSTLAANNMFLSTNLFKMQELLRPMSTSSPLPKSNKPETKTSASTSNTQLKIPTDIKKMDFSDLNMLSYKNKLDYASGELNLSSGSLLDTSKKSKTDFSASDLSISSNSEKRDYSVADLSISKSPYKSEFTMPDMKVPSIPSAAEYSLDLSRKETETSDKSSKMPKTDYSMDLSNFSIKNLSDYTANMVKGLTQMSNQPLSNDQPMNLASN